MFQRSKRHPSSHWRWWEAIGVAVFSFCGLGALIGLVPPFSSAALRFGLITGVMVALVAMWNWWSYNWWSRITLGVFWSLQIMAITVRSWSSLSDALWIWLLPLLGGYIVAWTLPSITPALSNLLWREQTAPQTRFGRIFFGLTLSIAPVAGVLGASFGMYGSRSGEIDLTLMVIGSLCSLGAIGFAFAFSYQLWPKRPWAQVVQKGEP
jgi:hypothetical protein